MLTKSFKIKEFCKNEEQRKNFTLLGIMSNLLMTRKEEKMRGKIKEKIIKCNVCDSKIELKKELVYEVAEYNGILAQKIYNAIDCQKCGCQKILYPRMKKINLDNKVGDNK